MGLPAARNVKVCVNCKRNPQLSVCRIKNYQFLANFCMLYPLKAPENQIFFGLFRRYEMGTLARNGSKYVKAFREVGDTLIIILSSLSPYAISKKSFESYFWNTHGFIIYAICVWSIIVIWGPISHDHVSLSHKLSYFDPCPQLSTSKSFYEC